MVKGVGWRWPFLPPDAKCPGHDGSGSHIHTLWSLDNDWLGANGDGIYKVQSGNQGQERRWWLKNGDPRGGIFAPRRVDDGNNIVIPMYHDPSWADTYHFYYESSPIAGGANLWAYDCAGNLVLPHEWLGAIRVRRIYNLFGLNILEIWTGTDALWEIYIFSSGIGLIGYKQWLYQQKAGRQVYFTQPLYDNHYVKGTAFGLSF